MDIYIVFNFNIISNGSLTNKELLHYTSILAKYKSLIADFLELLKENVYAHCIVAYRVNKKHVTFACL